MLIIKIFANEKQLDEIHVKVVDEAQGHLFVYEVRDEFWETKQNPPLVVHFPGDGWRVLAKKALERLEKEKGR